MAGRTGRRGVRRVFTGAMASGAVATGLLIAIGAGTAHADVLDDIDKQYDTGAGGGQISNLIHSAIKLRGQGFRPSVGNVSDLEAAMEKRPNQSPLILALQQTVQYQKQNQSRSGGGGGPVLNPPTLGIGGNPGSYPPDPNGGGGINIPLG